MKRAIWLTILMCCISSLTGCGALKAAATDIADSSERINPEDVSEEQFIEIISPEGKVLCQIKEKDDIVDYLQNQNWNSWEETGEIPETAKLQISIVSYEKVTEEFWKQEGVPEISVGREELYEDEGEFYIKELYEDDFTDFHIPVSTGNYMVECVQKGTDISDKDEIFASWGVMDFDTDTTEVWNMGDESEEDKDTSEESDIEKEDTEKVIYTVDELAKVSEEQKIEIHFETPENMYSMTELEDIAFFYNQLKKDTWTEIDRLPDEKREICVIKAYQSARRTRDKKLVENEELTVFEAEKQYYVLDKIPGIQPDTVDMELYYVIPEDIVSYIKSYE